MDAFKTQGFGSVQLSARTLGLGQLLLKTNVPAQEGRQGRLLYNLNLQTAESLAFIQELKTEPDVLAYLKEMTYPQLVAIQIIYCPPHSPVQEFHVDNKLPQVLFGLGISLSAQPLKTWFIPKSHKLACYTAVLKQRNLHKQAVQPLFPAVMYDGRIIHAGGRTDQDPDDNRLFLTFIDRAVDDHILKDSLADTLIAEKVLKLRQTSNFY